MMYELKPKYDSRGSFYKKAKVQKDGLYYSLYSYGVKVCEIYKGDVVVLNTHSQTTLRHIKEFLKQNGFKADSKQQILEDYGQVD